MRTASKQGDGSQGRAPSTSVLDLDDLDPPVKRVPIVVEITTTYLVWEEDYDDLGPEDLAKSIQRHGDYEVHKGGHSFDGSYVVRAMESWEFGEERDEHYMPMLPPKPYAPDVNRWGGYNAPSATYQPEYLATGPDGQTGVRWEPRR